MAKTNSKTESPVMGSWDNPAEFNFFGDNAPAQQVAQQENNAPKENEAVQETDKPTTETVQNADQGGNSASESSPKTDDTGKQELFVKSGVEVNPSDVAQQTDSFNGYRGILKHLQERGIISISDENFPKSDDEAINSLEDIIGQSVETRVEELISGLPDTMKNMVRYTLNGGDMNQFLQTIQNDTPRILNDNLDLDSEADQELIVSTQLASEGYDDVYVHNFVDFLKKSGGLQNAAEMHFNKWKEQENQRREQFVKQQQEAIRQEKETRRRMKATISNMVNARNSIGGIQLTANDRINLPSYIVDQTVKLDNGQSISKMQYDLYSALQNDEKVLVLAKLLQDGLKLDSVQRQVKTELTQEVKDNIRRTKNLGVPRSGGSSQTSNRSLADFF